MIVKIKISDVNIKKLMKNMVVIVDTREQANQHIIGYLNKKKIPFVVRKLDFGDYSCYLKADKELGLSQDVSLENRFVIEKKNSLEEISSNLTKGRKEFENEFIRANASGAKVHLMIENGSWDMINSHSYNTQFNEKSFYNSLLSFQKKYNLNIEFVSTDLAPTHIIRTFQMELKALLKE